MGEIADAMTDGTLCQFCGVVTGKRKGKDLIGPWEFPVMCMDCAKDYPKKYLESPGRSCVNEPVYYLKAEYYGNR